MAKKTTTTPKISKTAGKTIAKAAPVEAEATIASTTPVRNTAIPKIAAASIAKKDISFDQIAVRAFEIYASGQGGSQDENWIRAERELRGL